MADEFVHSEQPERLEFRYDGAIDEYKEFGRYSTTSGSEEKPPSGSEWSPGSALFAVIFLGLIIVAAFGKQWFGDEVGEMLRVGYAIVVKVAMALIGLVIVLLIVLRVWQHRRARALMTLKDQVCVITPEGVGFGSDLVSTQYRWPAIVQVVYMPSLVAFYVSPTTAFLLPKRAIESAENAARLSECLQRWYAGPVVEAGNPAIIAEHS